MGGLRKKWKRFWGAGEGRHGDPNLMRRANEVQWDPQTGRPIGLNGPPDQSVALEYQNRSNELIDQQRAARRSDALNFLRQGTSIAESYRPGGGAAMSSGLYGQMADASLNIANNLDYVDMMAGYREHQDYTARKQQYRANAMRLGASIVSTTAGALTGGLAMGPMGALVGAGLGSQAGAAFAKGLPSGGAQTAQGGDPTGFQDGSGGGEGAAQLPSGLASLSGPQPQAVATQAPVAQAGASAPPVFGAASIMPAPVQQQQPQGQKGGSAQQGAMPQTGAVGGSGPAMGPVASGGPGGGATGGGYGQPSGGQGAGGAAGGSASAPSGGAYPLAQSDPTQAIAMMTHMSQTDDNFDAGILEMANSMLADLMGSFGGR